MNDKTPIKIICRVINLILYVCIAFLIVLLAYTKLYEDIEPLNTFYSNYMNAIIVCAIPLIIMMIISLVIKFKMENESKINIYRIFETLTRIICTIPISFSIIYYIYQYTDFGEIADIAIGLAIFFIADKLMKFTLQETLSVTFIIHDEL